MGKLLLNENDEGLNCFFDVSMDLIAILDNEGYFKRVNNEWLEVLGWRKEEVLLFRWEELIQKKDIEQIRSFQFFKDSNIIKGLKVNCKCKDGSYKLIEWNCKYIVKSEIIIAIGRDITDKITIEEEKIAYEKAIHLENVKSEFFSNISHEFKTPLNIILATMQLINKKMESENVVTNESLNLTKYMASIRQNSYRLLRLVNNIIDINKIDNGYYNINLGNYNIISVVEDITMSVIEYVHEKGINLIFDTEIEEALIACDPDKIERIILNILSNAIKYTKDGGTIQVNIDKDYEYINIHISDEGIGIPKDELNRIFNRYNQVDNELTRKNNGSGIGLSLVKSLVEMHGGLVDVKSIIEEGTIFTIKLPIRQVENKEEIKSKNDIVRSRVEKCNIEFSDIYN